MNIQNLFETQRVLDGHILDKHPELKRTENLGWRLLALQVELGECANEWRGFKKWSNDQEPRTDKLLEEYVDCLHFVLGIGLEKVKSHGVEIEIRELSHRELKQVPIRNNDIISQFNDLFLDIGTLYDAAIDKVFGYQTIEDAYGNLWRDFMGLGEMLGFQLNEIEDAYYAKNQVNHNRQETNY